ALEVRFELSLLSGACHPNSQIGRPWRLPQGVMMSSPLSSVPASSASFRPSGVLTMPANETSVLIFGASGDLTARKLMPALFLLARKQYLPAQIPIIGVARREKTEESFRAELRESVSQHVREVTGAEWD